MKATMKKPQQSQDPDYEKPIVKNKINPKVLNKWLSDTMHVDEIENVVRVDVINLWSIGSIERYRINVWIEEKFENCVYLRNRIANSWFVHYDRSKEKIVNKTIKGEK